MLAELPHMKLHDTVFSHLTMAQSLGRSWLWVKRESERLGSSLGRCRRPPVLQGFAFEDAKRVAGNKMALNAERIVDKGVNRQEPLRLTRAI
jgi:hypothetical protein